MKLSSSTAINNLAVPVTYYHPRPEDLIRFMAGLGFKIFDFGFTEDMVKAHLGGASPEARFGGFRKTLAELGASCGQAHSCVPDALIKDDWAPLQKWVAAELDICKYLDIPRMVVHPGMMPGNTKDEFFDKNRDWYRSLMPLAEKWGVEIMTENIGSHGDIYYFVRDGRELRELVDHVDHPLFCACWDAGHANHHKQFCQYESIIALGDKLKALHIQDNFGSFGILEPHGWKPDIHQIPFFGHTNWDSVMQGLLDIGYKGTFNFEVLFPRLTHVDRRHFIYQGKEADKLSRPSLRMVELAAELMYETGKYILGAYNCFEA
ncbi:MAG: sugar phosphate isomerase/epimerase [Treponema sp.]|jgi:sugar phosphate isomerase/epimerase|nr:sugar phosphate isomerase/epimerase [Treponema sp.]